MDLWKSIIARKHLDKLYTSFFTIVINFDAFKNVLGINRETILL